MIVKQDGSSVLGGELLFGGSRPSGAEYEKGCYFEPTAFSFSDQSSSVCRDEIFGPVVSVLSFDTDEEALALANDTKHGLAAGIFTRSNARALRVSRAVRAGIVWVNTYRVVSPIAEFGGMKTSGYGRESGFQAMYDYTRPKTIWMNTSSEPMSNPFVMR